MRRPPIGGHRAAIARRNAPEGAQWGMRRAKKYTFGGRERQQAGDKVPATARQPAPSAPTAPVGARGRGWVHGCGRHVTSGLMIGRADHYAARSSARYVYTFGREPWRSTASQQRPPAHEGWAGGDSRAGECPRVGHY